MTPVGNKEQLIQNGATELNRKARKLALDSLDAALSSVDPRGIVKTKLQLRNSNLQVDEYSFDLDKFTNVYVIGGGKASGPMAEAVEQVLGSRISGGLVNIPHGTKHKTSIIELNNANHPVPDEAGAKGTRKMLKIAEQAAKEKSLVICLISGGGSSLMPLPRDNISIADKRELTDALLKSGATINEMNTVRKHISDFKGGWLAKKAYPATILNLILSDVISDPLDFIASGPTVPDSTTFSDAVRALEKYGLWEKAPVSVRKVLSDGEKGLIPETPKASDPAFKKVFNVIIGNNRSASLVAFEHLRKARLNTILLTTTMEGEAKQVGAFLSSVAREVVESGNPVPKPAGIVVGGETTVIVTGKGKGGRNQEISLAAALKLKGLDNVVLVSASTDGIDGPTDAAGAIVDGQTIGKALAKKMAAEEYLAGNDSYNFFSKLDDLIFTGPTGTNVNDLTIIIAL